MRLEEVEEAELVTIHHAEILNDVYGYVVVDPEEGAPYLYIAIPLDIKTAQGFADRLKHL